MSTPPSVSDLRARLGDLMTVDRVSLRRRLRGVEKIGSRRRTDDALASIERDLVSAEARVAARRASVPAKLSYPADLPITGWREELLDLIREEQVVIVAGETGSGKSTQLPKLCLELGRGVLGTIGHTQPRRIAARSIAERVAEEVKTEIGGLVGYTVRFTDQVGDGTLIKVMTDGILLNEIQRDRRLDRYDTIIIDEAHERSLNVDFLLGYLARLIPKRPDLKVIITSATIDTERFADHFGGAPVVEVSGRTYPVEVRYRPIDDPGPAEPRDQSQAICDAVVELTAEGQGDILVFCSGEREIRDAADALQELDLRHTEILPLFGRLSAAEQHRVFASHTGRRIVVATNVAETSLTVPGIRYVVDAGFARISRYSRRTKVQQLPIEPTSQASARQRAGRCGRLGPGIAIRLYAEDDFESRPEFTDPEILRTNLASVMLQMAAAGLGDITDFPFIDAPDTRSIRDGIALLEELSAVVPGREGRREWLTDIGRRLSRIPVDPRLGRMLLAAHDNDCLDEVLTIVSALSIQDPRERPLGKEQAADDRHRRFADAESDFLSWLHLWAYVTKEREARTSSRFRKMCRDEFLHWRRIREWQDLRSQLRRVMRDLGMHPNRKPATPALVHESLLSGLLSHVGKKDPDGWEYRGARGARFSIRPGSVLFKRSPEWVMAAELVETSRTWATGVVAIDPETVERVGAHLVKRSVSDPWWDATRGAAVARETVTLFGLPLSNDRIVQYGRYDPGVARELFVRHALVAGEWETHHSFVVRNAAQIDAVLAVEARERRGDLLVTDDTLVAFFDARLPADVASVRAFDRWWKEERERRPHLLDLGPDDLIEPEAAAIDEQAYPPVWHYGDLALDLDYEFDPASPFDGVTIDVPLAELDRIDPAVFEWNIPGLRVELVTALMRSLPKQLRKRFAPVPDTAAEVAAHIDPATGRLIETLGKELTRRSGTIVRPDDFDVDRVPTHLRPRFRIVDPDGGVVVEGDDLIRLRAGLRDDARASLAASAHPLERSGLTTWDFDALPRAVEIEGSGHPATVYPALVDDGDAVSVRLMATEAEQADAMWGGLRRLVLLNLPSPNRLMRTVLDRVGRPILIGSPYPSIAEWMEDCMACALDAVLAGSGAPVWDAVGFARLIDEVRADSADALESVGVDSVAVLEALQRLNLAFEETSDEVYGDALDDIDEQIDRFVFPGFLTAVGARRLDDVRRYLEAAEWRLRKLPEHPDRDRQRMAVVRELEAEHDRLAEVLTWTPELVDVAWMLQELRVSLFAQPIGARGPVSEKRIRAALRDLLT
jgi:ATP-dependent helicase HrpA